MKLVLKEKKRLGEVKTGKYGEVYVKMSPKTFLMLTLPADDYYIVERFLNEAKSLKDPEEIYALAKRIEEESDYEMYQIGKDVMMRGAFFLKKNGPFNPQMAGRLSLAIQMKDIPQVTSHGGRARNIIAALSGVPETDASILFYDMDLEQFLNDPNCALIRSQDFREGGTQMVRREEIKIED